MPCVPHPHTIFHNRRKNQNVKCSCKQSQIDWRRCTDKKEREIVLRETFQIAKKLATEENIEYILKKSLEVHNIREYLGILLGLECPPYRPYLYYQQRLSQYKSLKLLKKDQKFYLKMKFNQLPFEKQLKYLKRFVDNWLGFLSQLKKWKIQNNHFFEQALYKAAVAFPKEREKRLLKEKISVRKKFVELCMPHTKCDFPDAPEPPRVMTPLQLFRLILAGEGKPRDEKVLENAFLKLPRFMQNSIEDAVIYFREEFRTKLLNYVCAMTEAKRKLFLGLKREYYYKLFFVDIFEEKYPNEKYPVYKWNSDDFLKKAILKNEESSMETSPSKDDPSDSNHFDTFELIHDSLLRLKNYGFQIEESSDSDA